MKKFLIIALFCNVIMSCSVTETIEILDDGSGTMTITELQDFKKIKYVMPDFSILKKDTIVDDLISDVIAKNAELFGRMSKAEQDLYMLYANVRVQIQNNSKQQTGKVITLGKFSNINTLPNLHNAIDIRGNIINNRAISAKQKAGNLQFFYDGRIFKRMVKVLDTSYFAKENFSEIFYRNKLKDVAYTANYILDYKFPKKLKYVSNEKAVVSADKKQVSIVFSLLDVRRNPEITNFEVVFED